MGKPKHTPGPWGVGFRGRGRFAVYSTTGNRRGIAVMSNTQPVHEGELEHELNLIADANARLIAAAPEMLDVASGALGYLEALPAQCRPDEAWFAPLRLAIRKATGKE